MPPRHSRRPVSDRITSIGSLCGHDDSDPIGEAASDEARGSEYGPRRSVLPYYGTVLVTPTPSSPSSLRAPPRHPMITQEARRARRPTVTQSGTGTAASLLSPAIRDRVT
eukprot:768562-Hanusia_phi.AAC.5